MSVTATEQVVHYLPFNSNGDPQLPLQIGYMRRASLGDATGGTNRINFSLAQPTGSGTGRGGGLWYGLGRIYGSAPASMSGHLLVGPPGNWFNIPGETQIPTWIFSMVVIGNVSEVAVRAETQATNHIIGFPDGSGAATIAFEITNAAITLVVQFYFCVWRRDIWAFGGPRWPDFML